MDPRFRGDDTEWVEDMGHPTALLRQCRHSLARTAARPRFAIPDRRQSPGVHAPGLLRPGCALHRTACRL